MMSDWPKISVITPSYNQAKYLERTIRSVLEQNYPNLEYIVVDGGSTDGSVEIIKAYAHRLAYWVSERDSGQTSAINTGLRRATGEWVGWQNSDDIYYPDALFAVARTAGMEPSADIIIGNIMLIDSDDRPIRDVCYVRPSYQSMIAEGMVLANQAAFWRRGLHADIGWLDESLRYSFDYDWFIRLLKGHGAVHINRILGGFRLHEEAKTHHSPAVFQEENNRILNGREVGDWVRHGYQLRRLLLLLAQSNYRYVIRGLVRRARIGGNIRT